MNNIKRIIFDLDNTLIPWSNDYLEAVKKAVLEYNIPCPYEEIDRMYYISEETHSNYSISNLKETIKKELGIEVSEEFIKTWLDYLGDMAKPNQEVNELLKYLETKYDLVVLTNGFRDSQAKRLKTAGIREFFTDVYGGEKFMKPDPRSFIEACGPYLPEECLMIGDNYEVDIKGAITAGLQAIHLNEKEQSDSINRVRNLNELRNIL